jgi:hypothetical protein
MTRLLTLICIAFLIVPLICSAAYAQEEDPSGDTPDAQEEVSSEDKAEEAAKQLANPNATIGFLTFPTDVISYRGDLPDADSQNAFRVNFQPSLPYKLGEGVNLFVRPLFPIVFKQPVYTENGFEDVGVEIGDISMDTAVGKSFKNGLVTMFGGFVSFPTASSDYLGTDRYLAGPEFVIGKVGDWGSFYVLLYQSWSVSGNDENETISITGGQYFYTINLGNAWQIQGQPTFTYNHNAPEGSKWTFPIGGGISKTVMLGDLPVKFGAQYWYYLASNESFGQKHQVRFLITPVIPLPW